MGKMGGDRRTKRAAAPSFWAIPRKLHRFTYTPSPGPHPLEACYPLAVLLRDLLRVVKTGREARTVIHGGNVLVDGVVRRDPSLPVGIMDVISIPPLKNAYYRLLPFNGIPLKPHLISPDEASLKPCRVKSKVAVKKGMIQLGFHDGRTLLQPSDTTVKPGYTCLLRVPGQKLEKTIPLKEGNLALIVRGVSAGRVGTLLAVEPGTFSRPAMVRVDLEGEQRHLPKESVFAIGVKQPAISLPH